MRKNNAEMNTELQGLSEMNAKRLQGLQAMIVIQLQGL